MIQSVSQLNNKVEIGDIKDKQNEEEVDDKTERTIKNLRITPATPSEQQTELLRFIARKESKVLELREELKRQEEELRLLKNQWKTIVSNEKSIKPNDDVMVNGTTETIGDEGIKFIGRGFNSVIGGINKVKDEATLEKISQIKTAVSEVANSTPVKKTRKKTVDFTSQAWSNISKGFSSLVESKAIKTAKRKTLETVHTVERTINEALVPQSLYAQCPTVSSTPATSPKLSNSTVTSSFSTTESFDSTDVTFKTFNESHDNNNDSNGIITKEIISSPNITTTTITNGSPTSSASIISFTTLTPSPTSLNFPTNNTSYTAINTNNNNNNNTIIFDNKPLDTNVSSSNFAITSDASDVEDEDDGPSSYFLDDKDS